MKILLVDDEPALRELLRATFEGADVSVDEAGSGLEAEARIRLSHPDVIVLDLRMPAGAAALVRKPFSPLELLAVVESVAGGRPLARRSRRGKPAEEELLLYARDLQHMLEIERGQRTLLQQSYLATVTSLAGALESRDLRTGAHSQRVQRYALELLNLVDPGRIEREPGLQYGFLLHDIGKIAIPDQILQKPGPLTTGERRRMQTHTVVGEQMLGEVAVLAGEGLRVVRSHHERWDGAGYPDKLSGNEIPVGARVFAVADALDAMTSDRPYRRKIRWSAACDEIVSQSGSQFDPDVIDAFRERERALRNVRRELATA